MEPVATDDVFEADPGGFPRSRSEPVQIKVMKPRIISLRRGFFMFGRRSLSLQQRRAPQASDPRRRLTLKGLHIP